MRTLKKGTRGKDVKTLQGMLNQLGNRLIVDGVFGPSTENAVLDFQSFAGLSADGVVGDGTWGALRERLAPPASESSEESDASHRIFDDDDFTRLPTWDSHTDRRIGRLHPNIQVTARTLIILLEREMRKTVRVTSGFRSFAEQDELFAQGRTMPGGRVTNARAGQSYHNYGLAFDVVEIKRGRALWDNPDWQLIGDLGVRLGFEWGGNWTRFKDKPHFQMTFGKTTAQLLEQHRAGRLRDGFVIID